MEDQVSCSDTVKVGNVYDGGVPVVIQRPPFRD